GGGLVQRVARGGLVQCTVQDEAAGDAGDADQVGCLDCAHVVPPQCPDFTASTPCAIGTCATFPETLPAAGDRFGLLLPPEGNPCAYPSSCLPRTRPRACARRCRGCARPSPTRS